MPNARVTMATCYTNYDLSIFQSTASAPKSSQHTEQDVPAVQRLQNQRQPQYLQNSRRSSVAGGKAFVTLTTAATAATLSAAVNSNLNTQKDYSIPLHVDCSVEYELPNQPKPPSGQRIEPLLMIHPCYFRKIESQRRSPFINNMPIASRNSATVVVGLTSTQNVNIAPTIISNSRKSSARQQQQPQIVLQTHHNPISQSLSTQYSSIHHHQQQIRSTQVNPQQQMSQMSQQAHYPVVSVSSSMISTAGGQYIERASAIRRAAAAAVASAQKQSRSASTSLQQQQKHSLYQSQNHQPNQLVQKSSSLSTSHWDKLAAVATIVTSIAPHDCNILQAAPNLSSHVVCSIKGCTNSKASVGKRDAMISGGYAENSANVCTTRDQINKTSSNISLASKFKSSNLKNDYGVSTSLVEATNLRWNSSSSSSLLVDRSPIATVPSNYQAGPDTTPTPLHNTLKINSDNNKNISNGAKYRHYLRSQRLHPYLASSSNYAAASLGSSASHTGKILPQFSVTSAVAPTSSFQQNQQEISCYNV